MSCLTLRVLLAGALLTVGVIPPSHATAWRDATPEEQREIKRAALRYCVNHQEASVEYPCRWSGNVRVSTVSPRYAWASVYGPHYDSSGVLRRPHKQSDRWQMIRVIGGGIQPCWYWTRAIPLGVVRDFGIRGYREGSQDFRYHPC
jgi:hypothetical protein